MISSLCGVVAEKRMDGIVIECGGVGYDVLLPLTVLENIPPVGETAKVLTELVVREDSQQLFGFATSNERLLFRRLIKVSGIGAKTAMAMMSTMTVSEILQALADEDTTALATAPGIGKKTADRLIVDFRGNPMLSSIKGEAGGSANNEVEQALASLGYKKNEVKNALTYLAENHAPEKDVAARVRLALRWLSR